MKGARGTGVSTYQNGRTRTSAALTQAVREKVDPYELVALALDIARGLPLVKDLTWLRNANLAKRAGQKPPPIEGVEVTWPSTSERLQAITWLRDSGYAKPPQQVEIAPMAPPPARDYSKLSDEELNELERLQAKTLAESAGQPASALEPEEGP